MRRTMIGIGSMALFGALALAPASGQQQTRGTGNLLGPGEQAPQTNLFDLKGQVFVLEFVNPTDDKWVELHKSKRFGKDGQLKQTFEQYREEGVVWLTICPYDATGQGQAGVPRMDPRELRETIKNLDLETPVLFDEGGKIMKAFGITEIPHVVIIDKTGKIAYSEGLRGSSGDFVGLDTFDRAVGDAARAPYQPGTTLPAGAPREGQDRERTGETERGRTTPEGERERQERPR